MSDTPYDFQPEPLISVVSRIARRLFRPVDLNDVLTPPDVQPWYDRHTYAGQCRAAFENAARIDQDAFFAMATDGLPEITHASIKDSVTEGRFGIEYGGADFSDEYTVNFGTRTIGGGDMINNRNDRITGRKMFGLRAVTGLVLDFNTMGLTAGNVMGAFVWAKAGVQVHIHSRSLLVESLQHRIKALRSELPQEEYAQLSKLTQLKDDDDLMAIARDTRIVPDADILWNDIRRMENKYAESHRTYVERGFLQGRQMSVGQFMLCGLSYDAVIDLNDKQQMTRVENYTAVPIRALARRHKRQVLNG